MTEDRGTGIPTIQDELAKNGSPRVTIETDEQRSFFLIDIPVHEGYGNIVELHDASVNASVNVVSMLTKRNITSCASVKNHNQGEIFFLILVLFITQRTIRDL